MPALFRFTLGVKRRRESTDSPSSPFFAFFARSNCSFQDKLASIMIPSQMLPARSLVRTAAPSAGGLTVGFAVRTDRGWPK